MKLIEESRTFDYKCVCKENGYKVVVNVTTKDGKISNLNGTIRSEAEPVDGQEAEVVSFRGYRSEKGWTTEYRASNEMYTAVSALALAAVNAAVAKYETA